MPLPISYQLKYITDRSETLCRDIKFDDAAFEIFFKNTFTPVCSYCQIKFGFDIDEAKDAVHTGFIKLWESRKILPADVPVKGYLYKIVTNVCIDILRHQRIKHKHEQYMLQTGSDNGIQNSFDNPDAKHLASDIYKAVAELPEQMRKVFELSRYEGLKYSEISSHLNISVKTVETQMSRALVKLRRKLSNYLPLYFILLFSIF